MMDSGTFQPMAEWLLRHGYLLMFLAMFIEGPVITSAAAFTAALGYFNLLLVFILSCTGDIAADVAYYAIGYGSRGKWGKKFAEHFRWACERGEQIEEFLLANAWKTLIVIKLTPGFPGPGLMMVGALKIPFERFALISSAIALPKSFLFLIIGYYFGNAYEAGYFRYGQYGLVALLAGC